MNKLLICFLTSIALNTGAQSLTGVWTLVAVENTLADQTRTFPYGDRPAGMMVLNPDGSYAIQILKADRPLVFANDKNRATVEENAALVQGNNSHFGKYEVDGSQKKITFKIEHAFYPNWEGMTQVRDFLLSGDTLEYVVTNTTNGGAIKAKVVWQRKR